MIDFSYIFFYEATYRHIQKNPNINLDSKKLLEDGLARWI